METISISQIGLYNPQRQSHEVTKKLFAVRQKQFNLLFEKIWQEEDNSIPQHYLIVGHRGMGKTTILKRMQVEFYKHKNFIPLLFPEEQYNVKDLAEFWLNCLDALADSLELEQYAAEKVKNIDDKIKELSVKGSQTISEDAYQFLMTVCRELHRRPVLLVDNIGLVFNRLNKREQHVLRALLSENGAPVVVGAGVTVSDDVIRYDMPFYDFFQIQYLKKLNFEEFTELLKNLATVTGSDGKVLISMQKNIPRQKTLLALTGGNPRTTVMLFKLIANGFSKDINDDLEALADEATPLYKAKYEELPMQQQIIIDAIAMNWDAIPLNKLTTATRMKNNQLSPQLKRLIDDGWIETTPAYKAKGNAYLISERFFNIWFLIRRSSRRKKEQIHCLSRFLECFYGEERIKQEADIFLIEDIKDYKQILLGLSLAESEFSNQELKRQLRHKIYDSIFELSETEEEILEQFEIPKEQLKKKIQILGMDKIKDLTTKLKFKDAKFWEYIANDLFYKKYYENAIVCYDKVLELNSDNRNAWSWKSHCLYKIQRYDEAIRCIDNAIKLNPQNASSWRLKGNCLLRILQFEKSIVCYEKSIELQPNNEFAYYGKAKCLSYLECYDEAAFVFEQTISLNSELVYPKFHLIFLYRDILGKIKEAEELFNSIDEKNIRQNDYENKKFAISFYYIHKMLFELYKRNEGLAKKYLLQAFELLEKENMLSSIVDSHWLILSVGVVLKLNYGSWLLENLAEKGFDKILSPYFVAVQAIEIANSESIEKAEIYLKNRAVEIADPARIIIEKIKTYGK
jgi:tetratricopeptide (TPR) repeat protein